MSSGFQGKKPPQPFSLFKSFSVAIEGILGAIKKERNIRIHLFAAVAVIILSIYFSISAIEWICIALAIGGMLSLELLNSAIERVVDMVTTDYHPLAKQAKDMAAGAVFVFALITVVIGIIIFIPKILSLLGHLF